VAQRKIVAKASLAGSPDYVRWVQPTRKAWVTEPDGDRIEVFSSASAGSGVDVIAYSPSLRRLYVPGASSATLTILGVDESGRLATLATIPAVNGAHCVAADDKSGVWVCDPHHGRLLYLKDDLTTGGR
jgi:hypothetical protein